MQKQCFLSFPFHLSRALWWIVYASIHLSCTFRPIIAPTWDSTQDNVGIFDNMDCENETLFWINKQHGLELLDWDFHIFALRCIISNNTFFTLCLLSVIIWAVLENALRLLHRELTLPQCCDFTNSRTYNMNDIWKDGLHSRHVTPFSQLCLTESLPVLCCTYHSQLLA